MAEERLNYDEAIAYLKMKPEEIQTAWGNPTQHPAGKLFEFLAKDRDNIFWNNNGRECIAGCLIQIKTGEPLYRLPQTDLMDKIRRDPRVPMRVSDIIPNNLEVFKEYQELVDQLIRKV